MGKEGDIPEIPMEEQVRNELLDIQKGQRQLTAAETACFVRVLAEVIPAASLRELKAIATQRVP
ncbi:MAG TPA: hypothetical protein VLF20_05275, partial [Patescibacteria group bacterium]|nr:hypothetical protein [Patescibacteria group bacterium]